MKRCYLTALLVASATVASCTNTPKVSFKYAERRGRLHSNGLRFVIMPDASTDLVQVDVRYEVGSKEDPKGKNGIAHFVEHMMFQIRPPVEGSDVAPPPMFETLQNMTTFMNAYTNWDTTHYMNQASNDKLEALLTIEAKRMYYRCQTVPEKEFLREREVVRNENRQRGGTADGQMWPTVLADMLPANHAYRDMIGGTDETAASITFQDVCTFMDKYYVPENATVIVAGRVDVDETVKMIDRLFSTVERKPVGAKVEVAPVTVTSSKKDVDIDIEHPVVAASWIVPATNTKEGEAVQYGLNQAFFKTAAKASEYGFARKVTPSYLGGKYGGVFSVFVELKSASDYGEAVEFLRKSAASAHRGFDEIGYEEMELQKKQAQASFLQGLEPLMGRTNMVGDLVQFDTQVEFDSNDVYIGHELAKFSKFDGEFVASAVKRALNPDKMRLVYFKPNAQGIKGDVRAKVEFNADAHEARQFTGIDPKEATRPFKLPKDIKGFAGASTFTLGNGMNVVLLPVHSMPLVSARLVFANVGLASHENPEIPDAAANFRSLPLDADAFAMTGIGVNCGAAEDSVACTSGGLNIYLDVIVQGLERIIKAGTFNQKGIEKYQSRFKDNYGREAREESEFERQFRGALYGEAHPYTRVVATTPAQVAALSQDKLESYLSSRFVAGNASLVIAGDFDPKKAESLVRSTFGGWSKGTVAEGIAATPTPRTGAVYVGVIAKEQPQIAVNIGYPAPSGTDKLTAVRRIVAEMLTARMAAVRTKLGATYGVYGMLATHVGTSHYQIGGTVDAEKAGLALAAMREGVDAVRKGTETTEDFVVARRKMVQRLLALSTVTSELAGRLASMAVYKDGPEAYAENLRRTAAASPALLAAIVGADLDPTKEVIVAKGTRAQLEKMFREAGINDVKYVEPADK